MWGDDNYWKGVRGKDNSNKNGKNKSIMAQYGCLCRY